MANKSKTRKAGSRRSSHASRQATRSSVSNRWGTSSSRQYLKQIEALVRRSTKPNISKEQLINNLNKIKHLIARIEFELNN